MAARRAEAKGRVPTGESAAGGSGLPSSMSDVAMIPRSACLQLGCDLQIETGSVSHSDQYMVIYTSKCETAFRFASSRTHISRA